MKRQARWASILVAAVYVCVVELPAADSGSLSKFVREDGDLAKTPTWVVDPALPGAALPPIGRSLFDFVATPREGKGPVVPFPFTALLDRISEGLRRDPATGDTGLKKVLIPLGRSLQRTAAAPDFFAFPRVVAAVDGEAKSGNDPLLRDRLYLGYQEKANLIEVIGYNEAAGRFEFQVVKDYGPGLTPKIFYANRHLCMSCHQNGGPIFSRQVWDETNANPKIAALLRARKRDFYGVDLNRGVDIPFAIDNATERANRLAAYQLLWREGCGGDDAAALSCRAGLFSAALQYRLSGEQQFDRDAPSFKAAAGRLTQVVKQRWPHGLAIGNADIPNRDPLAGERALALSREPAAEADNMELGRQAELSHVAAPFDPLALRPPLEVWRVDRPSEVARIVAGVGEFFAQSDIDRLDAQLFRSALQQTASRRSFRASCAFTPGAATDRTRFDFVCAEKPGTIGVNLRGRLELRGRRVLRVIIDQLRLPGQQADLRDVETDTPAVRLRGKEQRVELRLRRGAAHVRGADGDAVERLNLAWTGSSGVMSGTVEVIVLGDFAPVERAVESMLRASLDRKGERRFDGFAALSLRRARLLPALFAELGIERRDWCCLEDAGLPLPALESLLPEAPVVQVQSGAAMSGLQGFYRYCANCHMTAERLPPNFLAGSPAQVGGKFSQCAERIFVRLAMNKVDQATRAKTPMPPATALAGLHLTEAAWRDSTEFAQLSAYVSGLLEKQTGHQPDPNELIDRGYENLRPCLPDSLPAQSAAAH